MVGGNRDGWLCYDEDIKSFPKNSRPRGGSSQNNDLMIIYFTSGTTSMPKWHVTISPIPGHIVTAKWQRVGKRPILPWRTRAGPNSAGARSMDSGYGAVQFVYDMDRFVPERLLRSAQSIGCPPSALSDHLSFPIHHDLESMISLHWYTAQQRRTFESTGFLYMGEGNRAQDI